MRLSLTLCGPAAPGGSQISKAIPHGKPRQAGILCVSKAGSAWDLQRLRVGLSSYFAAYLPRYCLTEKVSCKVAAELLPTQTSKPEGSATQPFFAALQ
jgi:hypothetical protein